MKFRFWIALLLVLLLVTSCLSIPLQSPGIEESATYTVTPTSTLTETPSPTPTVTLTPVPPSPTPTPWALDHFTSGKLYPGVEPVHYVADTCTYLENRWDEDKSVPGTIVVPIMFHSIIKPGKAVTEPSAISMEYFELFVATAEELGFETITVAELVGFLNENNAIPKHSMLLILDDRKPGTAELFLPYLEANGWTLTLAYPTGDYIPDSEWEQMEGLAATGMFDIQSHGFNHVYIQDFTPVEVVEEEIYKPIDAIWEHFGMEIQSIIWPGGNFTQEAVDIAEEAGLEVGFTVYSRGPVMYNWIPLGEEERAMDNPLMVLPRAWSSAADVALYKALELSEAAEAQAAETQAMEQAYYELFCTAAEGD